MSASAPPPGWYGLGRLAGDPTIGRTLRGRRLAVGRAPGWPLWWSQVDDQLLFVEGGTVRAGDSTYGRELWRTRREAVAAAEAFVMAPPHTGLLDRLWMEHLRLATADARE